jgi:hypothetical protein
MIIKDTHLIKILQPLEIQKTYVSYAPLKAESIEWIIKWKKHATFKYEASMPEKKHFYLEFLFVVMI